ncbi:MAG: hypothetical protein SFU83_10910 [Meiothermus sp.]|nr:hypothetical protein [Meiothermus sp.]
MITFPLQRKRRQLVGLCFGSAIMTVVLGLLKLLVLPAALDLTLSLLIVLGLVVSFLAMLQLLQGHKLGISDGPDAELDERQLQVRNLAYLNAYRILAALVVLLLAGASVFWVYVRQLPDSIALTSFFWLIILTAVALPNALLAWLEPDPVGA